MERPITFLGIKPPSFRCDGLRMNEPTARVRLDYLKGAPVAEEELDAEALEVILENVTECLVRLGCERRSHAKQRQYPRPRPYTFQDAINRGEWP